MLSELYFGRFLNVITSAKTLKTHLLYLGYFLNYRLLVIKLIIINDINININIIDIINYYLKYIYLKIHFI